MRNVTYVINICWFKHIGTSVLIRLLLWTKLFLCISFNHFVSLRDLHVFESTIFG